jgi:branched-chain amino acid transport system permease protein
MDPIVYGQTLISGLFLGGIYALIAMGLTLMYGVMGIVNFAHGEFLTLGWYICFWAFTLDGIDPYIALPLAAVLMFVVGLAIQAVVIQPVLKAPFLNQILLTLGLSTAIVGAAQFFWGAQPRTILVSYARAGMMIGGVVVSYPRLVAFIVSVVVAVLLYLFLNRTKTGKAIRACAQSRPGARLMGIDVQRMFMLTTGIGASLTGIAGALLGPTYPFMPTTGGNFGFTAFVIVVLGSMGDFIGAFVASIIIGLAEAFGGLWLGDDVKQVVSMGIFVLVLLFRPQGLFGRKT